jgi:hypothetical protein
MSHSIIEHKGRVAVDITIRDERDHHPQCPRRFIRLHVVEVRFIAAKKPKGNMSDNIAIDVPAGQIARIVIAPTDETGKPAKLDGPVEATVLPGPTPETNTAEVAIGPSGLVVDIRLPDVPDAIATIELDGDADLDKGKREVITTLVTLRRLGEVPAKAVTLGAQQGVTLLPADQFGVFPEAPPAARLR